MPKGEHFKKENPRIIQVSFKVNQEEFDALQAIVQERNTSIPIWIREQILSYNNPGTQVRPQPQPQPQPKKEEKPVSVAPEKPLVKPSPQPKKPGESQYSLF
jgi:hypothetical protein